MNFLKTFLVLFQCSVTQSIGITFVGQINWRLHPHYLQVTPMFVSGSFFKTGNFQVSLQYCSGLLQGPYT